MEREEFLKHYVEVERPLRAFLLGATRDLHEADDLSQVVWQVLWAKLDQFDPARSFKAWSFGIARMEVLKWRQKKARSHQPLRDETLEMLANTGAAQADRLSARHGFLLDCIENLAALSRKVVAMKYVEGRLSKEIGKLVNRSTEAVDMILSRTRKALRECIKRKMDAAE